MLSASSSPLLLPGSKIITSSNLPKRTAFVTNQGQFFLKNSDAHFQFFSSSYTIHLINLIISSFRSGAALISSLQSRKILTCLWNTFKSNSLSFKMKIFLHIFSIMKGNHYQTRSKSSSFHPKFSQQTQFLPYFPYRVIINTLMNATAYLYIIFSSKFKTYFCRLRYHSLISLQYFCTFSWYSVNIILQMQHHATCLQNENHNVVEYQTVHFARKL